MKKRKFKNSIITSCADIVLPISLVLGAYIILHGHLSPGGGFQGGVLIAGAIAVFYTAYGRKGITKVFNSEKMKLSEDIGALAFVLTATLGIIYGASFFGNVLYKGTPGKLWSSGTIFFMNFAVGYKVLAGIGFLILAMLGTLKEDSEE
ncbi:MnhB domain-containing protein [Clostridium polynesiense]|uniref:MnhB domain-containing protein n=1 Tax=Clostridium polynesiense TaxID=1325933 RepID=UPI0005906EBF|nr:MnhB domain-containing protein [Clostridium polynesiense]